MIHKDTHFSQKEKKIIEKKFQRWNCAPLLRKGFGGDYVITGNADLRVSLQFFLTEVKSLLQAKEGFLFLNTDSGENLSISAVEQNIPSIYKEIIANTLKNSTVVKYKQGEKILNLKENLQIVSPGNIIYVSITAYTETLGAFLFTREPGNGYFEAEDEALLQSLSESLSMLFHYSALSKDGNLIFSDFLSSLIILLQKTFLYQKYKKSNATLKEVIYVSKMINSSRDLESLLFSIINSAKGVLTAESSSLLLIDEKSKEFYFNSVTGEKEVELKKIRVPVNKGIAGIVAKTGVPLIINNAESDKRVYRTVDEKTNFITRNMLCAPLKVQNKIIGVIEVINSIERENFTEADLNLFISFSDHAALAIHNRDLIDNLKSANINLEKKLRELTVLFQIGSIISLAKTEQELFDKSVKTISEVLGVKRCSIMLFDEQKKCFYLHSQFGLPEEIKLRQEFPFENTISAIAFQRGAIIREADIEKSKYLEFQRKGYLTNSFLVFPLILNENKIGVISFSDKEDETAFDRDDVDIITSVVNQVLKGYESIILHKKIINTENLQREVETSKKIQQAILPHQIPQVPGLDLAALSKPAKEVGGDFYDFIVLDKNRLGIVIADVSGKSLPAALFMASTSSIIRTLARDIKFTDVLCNQANDLIYQNSQSGMFVTLFYLIIDSVSKTLYYSSAGHNVQFLLKQNGNVKKLKAKGSPLGILPLDTIGPFEMQQIPFEKGDALVLYTDGVSEAVNSQKDEFTEQQMLRVVGKSIKKKADEIIKNVLNKVNQFAGEEPQFDDFTMVMVKFNAN